MKSITRRQFSRTSGLAVIGFTLPNLFSGMTWHGPKIKIGQIGTAHSHAGGKMDTLLKLHDVFDVVGIDVVGIVEEDTEKRTNARRDPIYQNLNWTTEKDLFKTEDLSAVAVETDLENLVPTALRCVDAGLHVHVDKPPGKSLESLKLLFENAKAQNVIVQMGYMFRYNPAFQFCLQAVKKGWLGDIFEVDGVISKTISDSRRPKLEKTYGGAMMLLGCHLIDILIALLGKPQNINSFRKQTHSQRDNLYDNELIICEYPNATASIRSALMEVEGQERRQFVVCGTEGTIEIKPLEPPQLRLALAKPLAAYKEGYQSISLPKMAGRYDPQLLDFAEMIHKEKESDFSTQHDLAVHEVLLKSCDLL
jgi:predicted dehydrogenase